MIYSLGVKVSLSWEVNSLNERIKSLNSELEELLAHEQAAATGTVPVSSTAITEYEGI